jgi:hypothetical protein
MLHHAVWVDRSCNTGLLPTSGVKNSLGTLFVGNIVALVEDGFTLLAFLRRGTQWHLLVRSFVSNNSLNFAYVDTQATIQQSQLYILERLQSSM